MCLKRKQVRNTRCRGKKAELKSFKNQIDAHYFCSIFKKKNAMNIIVEPSYLPDLTLCDFFPFPKVKFRLRRTRF